MKHAPSHPRFQAAALFSIVRLICLGCCETKNLFVKGCLLFSKDSPSFQQFFFSKIHCFYCLSVFFSKTLCFYDLSVFFFKDSPSLQQVFFSKALCFYDLSVFFLKDSPSFQHFFFSKTLFWSLVFFSKVSFSNKQTEQHWWNQQ